MHEQSKRLAVIMAGGSGERFWPLSRADRPKQLLRLSSPTATMLEEAVERIKIATRQLARSQMKWFRRFRNVHWLPGDRPVEENAAAVMELWK